MKTLLAILGIILAIQPVCGIAPLSAADEGTSSSIVEQEKDSTAIKKAVETYLKCYANRDINCMMSQVSGNYSSKEGDSVITYDEFRVDIESQLERFNDLSISNLNIQKPDISANTASVYAKFDLKALNLNTLDDIDVLRTVKFDLIKEGGTWKVISRVIVELTP